MPLPLQLAIKPIESPSIGPWYKGFEPRVEILPKGWDGIDGMPLQSDILVQHDVAVKVRDGCTLYCDIFRPADSGPGNKIPAIVAWSPFGKKYNSEGLLVHLPWRVGVRKDELSGLAKFEAPDPATFCARGYAVVNVDSRGAGDSDGSMVIMGSQEAEDGYDFIESLARMDWCTGNIGLAGNSHLAIVQWFIAALRPPSLKAIAPWEGAADLYREQFVRGGAWDSGLFDFITQHIIRGRHGMEDFAEMYKRSPLQNDYWKDKRANIKNINIPAYITASYSTALHTMGAIRGYLEVDNPNVWLRWTSTQEWHDIWAVPESIQELGDFFDRYLKGIKNDWERTPKVRMTVLKFGNEDPVYPINLEDYPVPNTDYRKLYLTSQNKLSANPPTEEGHISYNSEGNSQEFVSFNHTFMEKTQLVGLPKAIIYVSCDEFDDLTLYVLLRKLDCNGEPMFNLNIPWHRAPVARIEDIEEKDQAAVILYMGPLGILRASHRNIDESKSLHPQYPFHPHDREEKITPGTVVKLEIGIWAMGIEYQAGESISVQISGNFPLIAEYRDGSEIPPLEVKNRGRHKIHFGGEYPSHVILPFI
ncbi:alpha/beta-hydrolase [Penicillium cataractarum]|uniref:Alpha/beta-hydrolase n=1 Tax=Penicillium cataractarum TaxID=2100454 RepID=A0A9W9V6V1_9EURO|nr:alpha/beta-hydrolase [Penicillium cataractarum]KAJ5371093.1 alpha/beta-hydrolase [Penicillium cataractarum]